jgi:hypothetical protein
MRLCKFLKKREEIVEWWNYRDYVWYDLYDCHDI